MKQICLVAMVGIVLLSVGAASVWSQTVLPNSIMVRELQTPAEDGSAEPNLTRGRDGYLYMTWIQKNPDTSHTLFVSRYDTAGWAPARPISSGKGWFVNWADFPALAVGERGTTLASWLEKSGTDTYAYGVRLSHSVDGGRTWGDSFSPHDDKTETEHGFVSLLAFPDEEFGAVWLDGRQMVKPDGPMSLRFAQIDSKGGLDEEQLIDARVCDCCQTAMARCGDGSLVVAYRDRSNDEVRDISILRYAERKWSDPHSVHADNWRIAGCPVNGPALDAYDRVVAAAWFTMGSNDSARVNVAFSTDCGKNFASPVRVDMGMPLGRVDIALIDASSACVVWLQPNGNKTSLMMRVVAKDGQLSQPFSIAETTANRDSGFPHIAYDGQRLIIVWTDPSAGPRVSAAQVMLE